MKLLVFIFIAPALFFGTLVSPSHAQEIITFGPGETKIIGSIPYSVIGKYKARFRGFQGRITLDGRKIQSVYLEIEAASIISNSPWCDRLARSRRLLNAARYPKVIFKSDRIIHEADGYKVIGVLEMHGIKRKMTFPFNAKILIDPGTKKETLRLKGSWSINRKDFNISWNKLLDRGGIIVGDYFTVDWGINTFIEG